MFSWQLVLDWVLMSFVIEVCAFVWNTLALRLSSNQPGYPRWRHQMETFSALLALCAGNSPVPVNSPHKGQWRGALMFSLICAWINDWVNNREAGDLRRHRSHYDVNVITGVTLFLSVRRRRRRRRRHLHYHPRLQACVHTITPGHLFWFVSLLADWWPWSIDNLLRFWSNFSWPWP